MKKLLSIIVIVLLVVLIVIVLINMKNRIKMYPSNVEIYENGKQKIEFQVVKNDNQSLTYVIKNNTNKDIVFGADYEIEKEENGVWYKYGVVIDFIEIAYIVEPGKEYEDEIVYATVYGDLKQGKYRLVKKINSDVMVAEFSVQF